MIRVRRWKAPYRFFFFLVLMPMLGVFPYLRAVNNPNEYVRVFTAMSIVEKGTFSIDDPVTVWGWVNDMAKVPSKKDGVPHYFMVKAPLVVYAGVPGYALFSKVIAPTLGHHYPKVTDSTEERLWWLRMSTWALRLFTTQIPCLLFLVWFERYLRDFVQDPLIRYSAVAACGLGTNYLAYVHMFASHSPYAVVAFLSFAMTERERRLSHGDPKKRRVSRAFLAGFCTSACVALEYQSLFLAIILSVFGALTFWRPKRLLAFAAGGLLNIPGVMYFQWKAYGNPLTPGHQMLETAKFAAEHQRGLWGILWPTWDHVLALAVNPGFGFFGMSPFMWIGLLGIPLLVVRPLGTPTMRRALRLNTIVWSLGCAALFGVNAGFIEWRAGWTVGPRYLVACAPFFAYGAACALERFSGASRTRRALARGVAGGLALASVLTIGTVGLIQDTLPETIARPFAQFSIPMIRTGFVPHHVGEWFDWTTSTFFFVVLAAALLAPVVAGLWPTPIDDRRRYVLRFFAFAFALAAGMAPAFSVPEDGSKLLVLHPDTRVFPTVWEPPGRDRITTLRNEAERYGPRRPCLWYQLETLDRVVGQENQALKDMARAGGAPRESCPKSLF